MAVIEYRRIQITDTVGVVLSPQLHEGRHITSNWTYHLHAITPGGWVRLLSMNGTANDPEHAEELARELAAIRAEMLAEIEAEGRPTMDVGDYFQVGMDAKLAYYCDRCRVDAGVPCKTIRCDVRERALKDCPGDARGLALDVRRLNHRIKAAQKARAEKIYTIFCLQCERRFTAPGSCFCYWCADGNPTGPVPDNEVIYLTPLPIAVATH